MYKRQGLGRDFVSAITNRDYTMIMGTTILLATLVLSLIHILAVSGNHDSAERLDYAAGLLANQNVYIAGQQCELHGAEAVVEDDLPRCAPELPGEVYVLVGQQPGGETAPLTVGTVDSVDAAHFAGFSYTALGHIHRAQRVRCV